MPHRDSEDYKAQAIRKWEQSYKNVDSSHQDAVALRRLLKETQIAHLALLIENERLRKSGTTCSPEEMEVLRLLLAALPKAIFVKDIQDDYRILFWNEDNSELMGTVVENATGKNDYELFPATIAATIRRLDRQAVEESLHQNATTYTSASMFYGIQRNIIKDRSGEPLFIVGSVAQKTSAVEPTQLLLVQKTKLFQEAEEAILLFDKKALYACNDKALELYRVKSKEELLHLTILDLAPAQQPNGTSSAVVLKRQIRCLLKQKECSFYWLQQRPDETLLHTIVTISLVEYEGRTLTRIVLKDITKELQERFVLQQLEEKKKQDNDRNKRSSDRLKDIERIAHFGHWELDWATKNEYWSEELYRILGCEATKETPKRTDLHRYVHSDDKEQLSRAYDGLWRHQQGFYQRYRIIKEGQVPRYIEEDCSVEFDEKGQLLRVVGIVRDVSHQKQPVNDLVPSKHAADHLELEYAINQSTMVLMLDEKRQVLSTNKKFFEHTGYELEDLVGEVFAITDPTFHSKWFLKLLWETTARGEVWKGELKSKTKTGESYWADTAVVPFLDEQKNITKYIVLQYDATSRKQMEGELERNNEAEFAKLYQQQQRYIQEIEKRSVEWDRFFRLSTEMISVIEANGTISRVNPAFAKTLGYFPKDLIGRSAFDFIHPDDLEKSYAANNTIKDSNAIVNFVNRWRNIYGDYRWMSWQASMDAETDVSYCITRDITEERITYQRAEDFTHTLNQTTLVLVLNKQEQIISVNQKFCETSGFRESEVLGKPYGTLSNKEEEGLWHEVHTAIQQGKIWQGELKERTRDKVVYWTYTSIVPFLDDQGQMIQCIVTQSDITSRKQLEDKLREAKKEADKNAKIKEDFLANMSHEIRTPMNGVLGFSRLLLQTKMTNLQHEYAQSIYSSAENLLVIVNDILDVSKIESGIFKLNEMPFLFKKRIEDSLSILKVSVQKKNLKFSIHIDPRIPQMIVGVPDRLAQVLINLVGNAIKFTKTGCIVLSITRKNERLLFQVTDTGIGIREDKLETIFESFTQAENYTTREYGGTGLGLSISKKLVSVMGGEMGVESKLGEGSTFFFTLPFKKADERFNGDRMTNEKIVEPKADVPLVLVVEDNKVNQELVLIYLNLLQCNCHVAENGLEALHYIKKNQYDLILMDIQMPRMDGMAATAAIREIDTKVPIIAMSAHALERERARCFKIGMNNYISKPFKVEALQEIMTKYIKLPSQNAKGAVARVQYLDNNRVEKELEKSPSLLSSYTNVKISKELLHLFREELLQLINNMQESFRIGNVQRIQQQMHRIKPNFELFNLHEFFAWSDKIEILVTEKASISEIKVIYNRLENALPGLIEQINREIEQ